MSDSIDTASNDENTTLVLESCAGIHEAENMAPRGGFNGLIQDAPGGMSTAIVNGLSQQLIYQINLISPNALVSFDDLNVELGDAAFPFVPPAGKEALRKAIEKRGIKMVVNSAYRTLAQQMLLHNDKKKGLNPNPVAAPGRSNHQSGLALDIEDRDGWESFLEPLGWEPLANDPPHVDYQGAGARDLRSTTILAFQKLWNKNHPNSKIDEDGKFGPNTEAALNKSPSMGFAIAPWTDKPRALRLSRPLMEGADVRQLQEKLKTGGFDVKFADGIFGPGTDKAVKEFQAKKGLLVDGIAGAVTLKQFA
jgi:N-acetylmuramoyl-L-alanine amidase